MLLSLLVSPGTTAAEAIELSALGPEFAEWDVAAAPVAIWGRRVDKAERLKDGDRVEILRPLEIDPRDARRQLAIDGQFMGGARSVNTDTG